jgi:hypothetical protein
MKEFLERWWGLHPAGVKCSSCAEKHRIRSKFAQHTDLAGCGLCLSPERPDAHGDGWSDLEPDQVDTAQGAFLALPRTWQDHAEAVSGMPALESARFLGVPPGVRKRSRRMTRNGKRKFRLECRPGYRLRSGFVRPVQD